MKIILSENKKRLIDRYVDSRCRALQIEVQDPRFMMEQAKKSKGRGGIWDKTANWLSAAGNVPVWGKFPGMIGGAMKMGKELYNTVHPNKQGDWGNALSGLTDVVFSGAPGGGIVGKKIADYGAKELAKQGVKSYMKKKVGGDVAKITAKNVVKPIQQNYVPSDEATKKAGPAGFLSNLYLNRDQSNQPTVPNQPTHTPDHTPVIGPSMKI